jgi:hypothetical protein
VAAARGAGSSLDQNARQGPVQVFLWTMILWPQDLLRGRVLADHRFQMEMMSLVAEKMGPRAFCQLRTRNSAVPTGSCTAIRPS